jgi:hypothetical protein
MKIFEIIENTITGLEPVTLHDAQIYFRTEDSGGQEDDLIERLVSHARQTVEMEIDRSLIARDVKVYVREHTAYLPFGPVSGDVTIDSGEANIFGKAYPLVEVGKEAELSYTTKPCEYNLNATILELAFFWYERGEFMGAEIPPKIKTDLRRFSRRVFIA